MIVDYESDAPPPPPAPRAAPASGGLRSAPSQATRGLDDDERADRAAAEVVAAEEVRARVEVQAFQAIYAIAGRVTVPETGETKRVQIDEMQLDPALAVRAVPKREQKAYLYAKITVARGTPLLPGQVSLFRDTTFVGNGQPAAAGAGRGARAGLRHRRCDPRALRDRGGEARRDRHHHLVQDRYAQLSHHGQEPA